MRPLELLISYLTNAVMLLFRRIMLKTYAQNYNVLQKLYEIACTYSLHVLNADISSSILRIQRR